MELTGFASKNRDKIINIALIIITLIIANNIYKSQLNEIESLKRKKDLETKKNAVIESISKEEKIIAAHRGLLSKKDASSVINTIGELAKESGVKITSIRPVQEQVFPDYIKMPFNVVLSATNYHAVGNFISKLENYQDVYIIETINIESQGPSKELTVKLTISSIAFTG